VLNEKEKVFLGIYGSIKVKKLPFKDSSLFDFFPSPFKASLTSCSSAELVSASFDNGKIRKIKKRLKSKKYQRLKELNFQSKTNLIINQKRSTFFRH
jgi:hypothetical protein